MLGPKPEIPVAQYQVCLSPHSANFRLKLTFYQWDTARSLERRTPLYWSTQNQCFGTHPAPPSSARASRCPQHPQDRTARSMHRIYSYRRRSGPAISNYNCWNVLPRLQKSTSSTVAIGHSASCIFIPPAIQRQNIEAYSLLPAVPNFSSTSVF